MHLTCINNPLKPDRLDKDDWTREKCEGNLSTSLLEGSKGSEAALSDCENRAKREIGKQGSCLKRLGGSWVSHVR